MILLTVGGQLPFDRLVRHVDDWAGRNARVEVFAQIGSSAYEPRHMRYEKLVTPREFESLIERSAAVVAHAGMGTILSALERRKPIVVFPRRASHGEHRNDHQLATARRFSKAGLVHAAFDTDALDRLLDGIPDLEAAEGISDRASDELLARIRALVFDPQSG